MEGHKQDQCQAEYATCLYCPDRHKTGDKECPKQKKEQEIINTQDKFKVGRRAAVQILSGDHLYNQNQQNETEQPKHFSLMFTEDRTQSDTPAKRSVNPYQLVKSLTTLTGTKPTTVRSQGQEYVITAESQAMGKKLLSIKSILGMDCEVRKHSSFNTSTGLIYTYDIPAESVRIFTIAVKADYDLEEIKRADWIKPRNGKAMAFLVTFKKSELPNFITILGEQSKTKVYPYIQKPTKCRRCQQYLHTAKYCNSEVIACGKCSLDHLTETCTSASLKCYHCGDGHATGNRNCPKERTEQEIKSIQVQRKTTRRQAIVILQQTNPSHNMQFSRAVRGTLRPPQPQTPTPSQADQEVEAMENESATDKRRRNSSEEENGGEAEDERKRARGLTGQQVLVTTTPSRSEGSLQQDPNKEPIHYRTLTITENDLQSGSNALNIPLPPTLDTDTSENNLQLREEAEKIYNNEFQSKGNKMKSSTPSVRFKPFTFKKIVRQRRVSK